jgi:hypothetical protein
MRRKGFLIGRALILGRPMLRPSSSVRRIGMTGSRRLGLLLASLLATACNIHLADGGGGGGGGASGPGGEPGSHTTPEGLCMNTCFWADDGDCDDGGPDADYALCPYGTDCGDCGPRPAGGLIPESSLGDPASPEDLEIDVPGSSQNCTVGERLCGDVAGNAYNCTCYSGIGYLCYISTCWLNWDNTEVICPSCGPDGLYVPEQEDLDALYPPGADDPDEPDPGDPYGDVSPECRDVIQEEAESIPSTGDACVDRCVDNLISCMIATDCSSSCFDSYLTCSTACY